MSNRIHITVKKLVSGRERRLHTHTGQVDHDELLVHGRCNLIGFVEKNKNSEVKFNFFINKTGLHEHGVKGGPGGLAHVVVRWPSAAHSCWSCTRLGGDKLLPSATLHHNSRGALIPPLKFDNVFFRRSFPQTIASV